MDITQLQNHAYGLLSKHNLNDWRFEICRTAKIIGRCYYSEKVIQFSKYFLHMEDVLINDTILHEIAHALVGPNHDHNYVWQNKAREIGAVPKACSKVVTPTKKPTWFGVCDCRKHPFYRKPSRSFRCRNCRKTLILVPNL